MMVEETCPHCGGQIRRYRNPVPTVDIIIEYGHQGLVLIKRRKPPWGWALPGGFVEYGETLEEAAQREAKEETGLTVRLVGQFHAYSAPDRDPRQHTITMVFVAWGEGEPRPADDAAEVGVFPLEALPAPLAFDHAQILADYQRERARWLAHMTAFGR